MDLGKLIEFLHQYPSWYRSFVFLWIVVGAVLAGGLIVLRQESRTAPSPEALTEPSKAQASAAPFLAPMPTGSSLSSSTLPPDTVTAQVYFTTLRSLSERFLEKQEFIESMVGRPVEWEGIVESVSHRSPYLSVDFSVEGLPEKIVSASLPESLRTKAFSLQKGDVVRVKGKLSLTIPSMPDIDATELTLVKLKGAT